MWWWWWEGSLGERGAKIKHMPAHAHAHTHTAFQKIPRLPVVLFRTSQRKKFQTTLD